MNTEKEYQLMKSIIKLIPQRKPFLPNRYTAEQEIFAEKQIKKRMFILNLNLRPVLPLPDEIQMKIKRTALIDELIKKELPKYKWYAYDIMENTRFRLVDILKQIGDSRRRFNNASVFIYSNNNPQPVFKNTTRKILIEQLLDENNVKRKKSLTIKQLLNIYIKL